MLLPKQLFLAFGALVSLHSVSGAAAMMDTETTSQLFPSLVDWVVSKGGFFNSKQEYRALNDGTSFGLYATDTIQKGETLFDVPWECILFSKREHALSNAMQCETTFSLIREMNKGRESVYAPYVEYLQSLPTNMIPSAWSEEGKDLLELVCGYEQLPPDEPVLWLSKDWKMNCRGSTENETAALLVLSKGDDGLMVPLLDAYGHANGKAFNADSKIRHGIKYQMVATRNIQKGEAIRTSVNECSDCDDKKAYGTPEIMRDYGIVEPLPQTYHFHWQDFAFRVNQNEDKSIKVKWLRENPDAHDRVYLQTQLKRLVEVVKPTLLEIETQASIPIHEWNVITQYYEALVLALTSAIEAAGGMDDSLCPGETNENGMCIVEDGYDDLEDVHIAFNDYQSYCDNRGIMEMQADHMTLIDRDINDVVKSPYQRLVFLDHEIDGVKDKCLELDDMLQICSSFRPHYHDYVTHFPARYKQEIKRVLFVGGGDSMVLHEMLKYPNIELIVGLELDQTVVRESMKQFRTSPHFDDERVQWWFGDATKSLLMLPKEYFGSFDMVMVDLSETVMSFSIIKNLDIMEALALLIKPDGIMIKNDLHFRKMSDIFDYTIQLSVKDTPLICEQAFVLGSNVVDFLRPDANVITKGHGVDMLLLEPVKDIDDSFKLVQKYRKNDARQQGKCDNLVSDADVKVKRAGLFMVVEAENAKGPLMGDKLEKAIKLAIESQGLTPISTIRNLSKTKGEHIVIVMKEGIIVARTWPKEKYCAFDIHLWGRFNRMDDVKSALSNAVGSKKESVSSFRIIVGGMRGTDTWKDDKKVIGPKISYNRDCDVHPGTGAIDQGVIDTVVDESLNLIDQENAVCLVICGSEDQTCSSFDVVQKSDKVKSVIPIYTCPNVKNVEFHSDANTRMSACEIETLKTIRDQVAKKGAISSLVLDTSTPMSMVQIMTNILHNPRNQGKLLMSRVVFLAPMPIEHGDEFWRTAFLDRSRSNLSHDSKFRVEMMLHGADNDVEIGLLSTGNSKFFSRLVEFSDAVQSRTGVQVKISDIIGAPPKDSEEYKPKYFTTEDYGDSNEEQYKTQKPLGHQIVSQIKISSGKSASAFGEVLSSAIYASLKEAKFSETPVQVFDQVGDGIVVFAVAPEGTALAVWDGNQRITLNVFSFESDDAISIFETFTKNLPSAKALSRDEQPRGINRVVNFAKDV